MLRTVARRLIGYALFPHRRRLVRESTFLRDPEIRERFRALQARCAARVDEKNIYALF